MIRIQLFDGFISLQQRIRHNSLSVRLIGDIPCQQCRMVPESQDLIHQQLFSFSGCAALVAGNTHSSSSSHRKELVMDLHPKGGTAVHVCPAVIQRLLFNELIRGDHVESSDSLLLRKGWMNRGAAIKTEREERHTVNHEQAAEMVNLDFIGFPR